MVNCIRNWLWTGLLLLDYVICAVMSLPDSVALLRLYGSTESLDFQKGMALAMLRQARALNSSEIVEFCAEWYEAKLDGKEFYDN